MHTQCIAQRVPIRMSSLNAQGPAIYFHIMTHNHELRFEQKTFWVLMLVFGLEKVVGCETLSCGS